jgi:ABC-type glutathione transport system ATPase component
MKRRAPAVSGAASLADILPIGAPQRMLIELRGVGKQFRTERTEIFALAEIDLRIGRGELVSIHGPSGSGKSTLLSILGLLDTPSEGQYHLDGLDTQSLAPPARAVDRAEATGRDPLLDPEAAVERHADQRIVLVRTAIMASVVIERVRHRRGVNERVDATYSTNLVSPRNRDPRP